MIDNVGMRPEISLICVKIWRKISSDATPSLISAPPESQSISRGQRCASASCICLMSLTPVEIVTEPAAMAESKIATATARPCIMPCPVNKRRSPCRGSRSGRGARSSTNVPGSNRQAIFSWTVSLPLACWRAIAWKSGRVQTSRRCLRLCARLWSVRTRAMRCH